MSNPDDRRLTRSVLEHLMKVLGDTAEPAQGPAPPGRLGRYLLEEEIGRGGAGVVYRAFDTELRRRVALKSIAAFAGDKQLKRFVREAQTAAQLKHPNIVTVYDTGEVEGGLFITMELVEGIPFDKALPRLSRAQVLDIVRDVARALQYAHDRGIVHRDVKPGNILLRADGTPVVVDFGLARQADPASRITATGALVGTPAYLSPEQARGRPEEVDARTDVYGLGVVLYEALTGKLPFTAPTMYEQVRAILEQEPAPPRSLDPSIPPDLEQVVLEAMEKERRFRTPSAAKLAADLDAVIRGEPLRRRRGRVFPWLRRRRKPLLLAGAALALAALGAAGTLLVRPCPSGKRG